MPESIIQPDTEHADKSIPIVEQAEETPIDDTLPTGKVAVIWTPRFIVMFVLTLVLGLSLESILTQYVLNGWLPPPVVLIVHTLPVLGYWIALIVSTRSPWLRFGCVFGCIWAVFASSSFVLRNLPLDPNSVLLVQVNAATNCALLGAYTCLSVERTLFHRWDHLFFRFASIFGACAIAVIYFLLPNEIRSPHVLESVTAAVLLFFCIFIWWLRPSCWRSIPGPTFLFGLTPIILLLFAVPDTSNDGANFFFTQVTLLSLLLGLMRMVQGEIQSRLL